jgi:predicted RNA-binding Zn ribbon-like protein
MQSGPMGTDVSSDKLDFIGGHLAINFVNTLRARFGEPFEVFKRDDDVKDWFRRAGLSSPSKSANWSHGALLRKARQLREIALTSIEIRKNGKRPSLHALNSLLARSTSHLQLVTRWRSNIKIERVYRSRTVEEYLAPIAESLADLLANGDFDLIRHCEGDKCVLWFYDRTKAHRRRWCSPTVCGNRAKVAAFRARSHGRPI